MRRVSGRLPGGELEVLIVALLDPAADPPEDLAAVYWRRECSPSRADHHQWRVKKSCSNHAFLISTAVLPVPLPGGEGRGEGDRLSWIALTTNAGRVAVRSGPKRGTSKILADERP